MTNRRFSIDLENLDLSEYLEMLFNLGEFNSHNTYCYFSCTAHLFCVSRKHAYFTTFTVYTYCT
jgi:hypothetical protein